MKKMTRIVGMIAFGTGLALSPAMAEEEVEVKIKDLPKAVKKAVKKNFPNGKMVEAEKEKENGQWVYEVEVIFEGKKYEVELTPEGKILEVEEDD